MEDDAFCQFITAAGARGDAETEQSVCSSVCVGMEARNTPQFCEPSKAMPGSKQRMKHMCATRPSVSSTDTEGSAFADSLAIWESALKRTLHVEKCSSTSLVAKPELGVRMCANVFNCESALNTLNLLATINGKGKGGLPGVWGTLKISEEQYLPNAKPLKGAISLLAGLNE